MGKMKRLAYKIAEGEPLNPEEEAYLAGRSKTCFNCNATIKHNNPFTDQYGHNFCSSICNTHYRMEMAYNVEREEMERDFFHELKHKSYE